MSKNNKFAKSLFIRNSFRSGRESLFFFCSLLPTGAVTGKALTAHGGPPGKARLRKIKALPRASVSPGIKRAMQQI